MSAGSHLRLDVQGLRGIAVLLVVLYHVGVPGFSGGFVGVDVFFVISGFVIGQSLLREVDRSGTIDFWAFYGRRIRRLLPAFVIMMIVTLLAGIAFLELGDVQSTGARTGLAGIFSVANWYLYRSNGDYFGIDEQSNPYLHLWSLGVEEQFYLVLPALVLGAVLLSRHCRWKPQHLVVAIIGSLSLVSLLWSEQLIDRFDVALAFYHPASRFWEMAAGVLLACTPQLRKRFGVVGLLATVMLAVTVLTYSDSTLFPGLAALPAVAAALAVIACAPTSSLLSTALGTRWLVWVGDRSYGWYLWHWPFLVMARQSFSDSLVVGTAAAVAALVPAALSYRFVEGRYVSSSPRMPRRAVAITACASVFTVTSLSFGVQAGAAQSWWSDVLTPAPDGISYLSGCHTDHTVDLGRCTFEPPGDSQGTIVLLGDSHAASLADGVIAAGHRLGYTIVTTSNNGCPFIDVTTTTTCDEHRRLAMARVAEIEPTLVVIAHSSPAIIATATLTGPLLKEDDGRPTTTRERAEQLWAEGLARTRARLAVLGVEMASIDSVPVHEVGAFAPTLVASSRQPLRMTAADLATQRDSTLAIEHAALTPGFTIDPADSICRSGVCSSTNDRGEWIYFDEAHLNRTGSLQLADQLAHEFDEILRRINASS